MDGGSVPDVAGLSVPESDRPVLRRLRAWVSAARWSLLVWSSMTLWSLVMFERVRVNHGNLSTARFDLGNMVQAVWSTAEGRPLEVTDGTGEQVLRLAGHIDPILALLAPLWVVAPTPMMLVAVQVGALALGALPVYWLGRRHLVSEAAAALLALAYLTYPWLAWSAVAAVHPVTLAIPLLLLAIWFLDNDRLFAFVVVAILALMCGELMGLALGSLGLWYALARGRRRAGLAIALLGTAWTVLAVLVVMPAFRDGPSVFEGYYSSVGGSPGAILGTVFTDPAAIVAQLTTAQDFAYVLLLAAPLAGLYMLAPALAVVALPQLFLNTLSDRDALVDPRSHYVAAIVPALIAATVLGLARVRPARQTLAAGIVFALSASMLVVAGPLPGSRFAEERFPARSAPHVAALHAALEPIPDGARVTSTNYVGAHLAERQYLYSFPVVKDAEWAILERTDPWAPPGTPGGEGARPAVMESLIARLEMDAGWTKIFDRSDVIVFKRTDR
jgi:uncharacterized membrane protein